MLLPLFEMPFFALLSGQIFSFLLGSFSRESLYDVLCRTDHNDIIAGGCLFQHLSVFSTKP